jgi:hypothetical protein
MLERRPIISKGINQMRNAKQRVPSQRSMMNALGLPTNEIVVAVSRAFKVEMSRALGNVSLALIDRKNFATRDALGSQCATHDFVDAHSIMMLAFESVVGRRPWTKPKFDSFDTVLINEAWEDRKMLGFLDAETRVELLRMLDDEKAAAEAAPVATPDEPGAVASVAVTDSIFQSFCRVTSDTRDALYQLRSLETRLASTLERKRVIAPIHPVVSAGLTQSVEASTYYAISAVQKAIAELEATHDALETLSTEIDNAGETLRETEGWEK